MRYLSLFTGIGGFELGIQNAVQNLSHAEKLEYEAESATSVGQGGLDADSSQQRLGNIECVGYSEVDKYAIQIYQRHFPNHTNYGDITKINADTLPDFELLVGGFPCQAFSIAGKRGGFNDTRGTLFFDIARILSAKRPRLFLLENVKGLLSHDGGRTLSTILATIDELGYDCQWQVLNSKNFGVPQNRERILIAGHLRGTPRPEVFPITGSDQKHSREANQQGCASTLTGRSAGGQNRRGNYIVHNLYGGFGEKKMREFHDYAPTIRTAAGGGHIPSVMHGAKIRRLTPVECERLQGFPDGWTEGVSDTQRYKTLGNAVTTNVIQAVAERLLA